MVDTRLAKVWTALFYAWFPAYVVIDWLHLTFLYPWLIGFYIFLGLLALPLYLQMERRGQTKGLPFRVAVGAPFLVVAGGLGIVMLLNAFGKAWVFLVGALLVTTTIVIGTLWIRSAVRQHARRGNDA